MTPAELVEILVRIEEKQDWLVRATKALLAERVGVQLDDLDDDLESWLAEAPLDEYPEDPNEHVAVRRPRRPQKAPCSHQHQVLKRGAVCCANCGERLVQGGIVGDPQRNGLAAAQTEWGQFSIQESNA